MLGVDSLRGGLAEGNRIAVCRWFNGIWCVHELLKWFSTLYRSKMENHLVEVVRSKPSTCIQVKAPHTPSPHFGLFGPICVPYPKGLIC